MSFPRRLLLSSSCAMLVAATVLAGCADMKVGRAAYKAHDYQTARDHFAKISEYGIPEAQVAYADMLMRGEGGPVDNVRARQLLEAAAANDYTKTYADLGKLYQNGLGGTVDLDRARWYYHSSLDAGNYRSAYELGRIAEDQGDLNLAADYYHRAYDNGIYAAAIRMGNLYEKKRMPPAPVKALAWYHVAKLRHELKADKAIEHVGRKMSLKDKQQARRMAETLYEKN